MLTVPYHAQINRAWAELHTPMTVPQWGHSAPSKHGSFHGRCVVDNLAAVGLGEECGSAWPVTKRTVHAIWAYYLGVTRERWSVFPNRVINVTL